MKKEVRKLVARQRKYDTGTGPFKGQEKMSPALEQLHQNIKTSSDGLIYPFDSEITNIRSTYLMYFSRNFIEVE